MSLTKIINDDDELVFDISNVARGARKQISIILVRRARPANVLVIRADRSIPISHIKKQSIEATDMSEDLQLYQCFKQVRAGKIISIKELGDGNESIMAADPKTVLTMSDGQTVTVDSEWMERFKPEVGGYYVAYEDGYTSFSPSRAFETGYAPV